MRGWELGAQPGASQARESGQSLSQGPAKGFRKRPKTREGRWWAGLGRGYPHSTSREEHRSHTGHRLFCEGILDSPQSPDPKKTLMPLSRSRCNSETFEVPFRGHNPSRLCPSLCRHQGPSPRPALIPRGMWGWTWPVGVTGGAASWRGWAGEGNPVPILFQAGHLLGGRPGWGALLGGVGSVRPLRSSGPVLWPVWARAALGAQGWGPWRPAGPAGIDCWFLFIEHRGWTRRFAKPKRHSAAATRY